MCHNCVFFNKNGFRLGRFFVSLSDILPLHTCVAVGSALSARCTRYVSEPNQLML